MRVPFFVFKAGRLVANFIANATGNISGSGGNPWAKEEAGASATQTANGTATNTTTSEVLCTAFTITNADVIDGVLLNCKQVTTTGTVTISIAKSGVDQQTVVVNASDLPVNQAWVFFKFTATATGDGTANWTIGVKGSSAGNATFYNNGSNNWARILRTTTTATPASTDSLYIAKELTGAGTSNARTVYMDVTCTAKGSISNVTNNGTLYRITSTAHGRSTGNVLSVQNVQSNPTGGHPYGNSTAGGQWTITVIDANTFDLQSSTFVAGYVCGGKWYLVPATTYGAITVAFGGTFQWGVSTGPAASTDYYLQVGALLTVQDSATLNMGTSGTTIPSTSTATFEMNCGSNVAFGLDSSSCTNATINFYGNAFGTTSVNQPLTADFGGLCDINAAGAVFGEEGQSFVGMTGSIIINGTTYTISSVTDATHLTLTTSPATTPGREYGGPSCGTTIKVGSTSGWVAGDIIALSNTDWLNTSTLPCAIETACISSITDSTHAVLTAAPTYYHAGGTVSVNSVKVQSDCCHLTRNVIIRGVSTANNGYLNFGPHTINMSYAEIYQLGSNTANKKGIDFATGTALSWAGLNITATYCSIHDFTVSGCQAFNLQPTTNPTIGGLSVTNNVWYNIGYEAVAILPINLAGTFTGNYAIQCGVTGANNAGCFYLGDVGTTYSSNVACAGSGNGFILLEDSRQAPNTPNPTIGGFSSNVAHGCNDGFAFTNGGNNYGLSGIGTLSSNAGWRNRTHNMTCTAWMTNAVFDSWTLFNGSGANIKVNNQSYAVGQKVTWSNCYFDNGPFASSDHSGGGNNQGTNCCVNTNGQILNWEFDTCQFSPSISCGKADLYIFNGSANQYLDVRFRNCTFGSTNLILNEGGGAGNLMAQTNFGSIFGFEKFNQIAGQHFALMSEATIAIDTTFYDASASDVKAERVQPVATTLKSKSSIKRVAVANGTAPTVSCVVRQSISSDVAASFSTGTGATFNSGAYSGAAARLMCKHNTAVGIGTGTPPADVVLATLTAVTGAITTATNASPIQITSTAHGLNTGDKIGISGALVNTAANGSWVITKVDANNFTLNGSTGNGAGTTGNWSKFVTLSGTPSTVTDDGCLEFYVDCGNSNGSAVGGFITVDTWKATGGATDDNGSEKYWIDGQSDTGLQTIPSSGGTPVLQSAIIQGLCAI